QAISPLSSDPKMSFEDFVAAEWDSRLGDALFSQNADGEWVERQLPPQEEKLLRAEFDTWKRTDARAEYDALSEGEFGSWSKTWRELDHDYDREKDEVFMETKMATIGVELRPGAIVVLKAQGLLSRTVSCDVETPWGRPLAVTLAPSGQSVWCS